MRLLGGSCDRKLRVLRDPAMGDALVLTGLHASAGALRDATGKLARTSSLSFTSLAVPVLALTVPPPPGSAMSLQTAPRVSGRVLGLGVVAAAFVVAVVALGGCAAPQAESPLVTWVATAALPLRGVDPRRADDDLVPLARAVDGWAIHA